MRNATIITISVLLIVLVIVEQIFIENTFNELEGEVVSIKQSISQTDDINTQENDDLIEQLYTYWDKKEEIMCLTMNHKDLDKIGEQISKIKTYITENNKEYAIYEIDILLFYIHSYQKVTNLTFKNIA